MSRPQSVSSVEILSVARAHFIARGHSATLSSIAQDLGLSHSALIQRFGSKRSLLIEALRPPQELPWSEGFLSGPPLEPSAALAQLYELSELLMSFLAAQMPQIRVLQAAGVSPTEIFADQLPLPLMACQRITEWIQRGVSRGVFDCDEPAAIASTLLSAMFFRSRLSQLCAESCAYSGASAETSTDELERELIGSREAVLEIIARSLLTPPKMITNSTRT